MGLIIAKRLVELMGGRIGFDSAPTSAATSGSRSRWNGGRRESRRRQGFPAHPRASGGGGNGASRKALARQLAAWNATVHAVPDGAAALATVEETDHPAPFDAKALIDSQDADLPVGALAHRLRDAGIGHLILLCPPGRAVEWHRLEAAGFSSVLR